MWLGIFVSPRNNNVDPPGTTGNPKGTMMSHDNVVFTAVQNTVFFKWNPGQESVLSYLPQCHMAGIMMVSNNKSLLPLLSYLLYRHRVFIPGPVHGDGQWGNLLLR